ncbi:MAG: beta-mannosidase, partial [Myxococcota bacterium]
METLSLNGKWKVRDEPLSCKGIGGLRRTVEADSRWIPASVPGEIHLDLLRAGVIDEPLISLNAKESRWPEKRSWWFVRTFRARAS